MARTRKTIPFELHILMGLPGSGKTYWATHNYPTNYFLNHVGRMIVSLDDFKDDAQHMVHNALNVEFKNYMQSCHVDKVDVCVDGPIFTYENLYKVIEDIVSYIRNNCFWKKRNYGDYSLSFVIHQWNEDRETCVYNDNKRNRNLKSTSTIKNQNYDIVDVNAIKNYLGEHNIEFNNVTKIDHMVEKTTLFQTRFEEVCDNSYISHGDERGRYMYSEEWSLGGEWGNCWGNKGVVEKENPKEFVELDDFLESIVPNISYLQYKKIRNHCVDTVQWHEHDYYSSGTNYTCWRCDMRKMYDMLKQMNLIFD